MHTYIQAHGYGFIFQSVDNTALICLTNHIVVEEVVVMTGHTSGQVQDDLTRLGDMEPTYKVNKLKLWKGEWWVLSSKYQVLLPDIMFWSLHKL